jgi:hypothetical protein
VQQGLVVQQVYKDQQVPRQLFLDQLDLQVLAVQLEQQDQQVQQAQLRAQQVLQVL